MIMNCGKENKHFQIYLFSQHVAATKTQTFICRSSGLAVLKTVYLLL